MTKGSAHQQKQCENVLGLKSKVTKKNKRTRTQPLSKLQHEKNQLVPKGFPQTSVSMETSEKMADSNIQPSTVPHLRCDVLEKMICKEQNYRHSKSFMQKHPGILPRMRSILLGWLIEVSEEYTLHRQTFYLAQDYFDRFMMTQSNIEKGMLQLIGITCLFIASKMEEAYPPKVSQMVHVTADTYSEEEILQMELIILKALGWNLFPETALSWLKLFFQMASMNKNSDLLEPQFPHDVYVQMTRLLDLCILHINALDFQYRVLAASVLSHFIQQETVEKVSGLSKESTQQCVRWMGPFVETVGLFGGAPLREFVRVKKEDKHNIQTHSDYLTMLECISEREVNSRFVTPNNSTEKLYTH